jgi:hypothetical protein
MNASQTVQGLHCNHAQETHLFVGYYSKSEIMGHKSNYLKHVTVAVPLFQTRQPFFYELKILLRFTIFLRVLPYSVKLGDTSANSAFINTVAKFTLCWHLTIQRGRRVDDGIG